MLAWAWDNRAEVRRRVDQVRQWFRGKGDDEKRSILIVGAGGVGKTTLGKIFSEPRDFLTDFDAEYTESIGVEQFSPVDDPVIEFVVPPGQEHRRETTWNDVPSDISSGKVRGLIVVNAAGHHTLGEISYKRHRLYDGNKGRFLERYLADRREEEVKILQHPAPHIRQTNRKLWILSFVSKQDLWRARQETVEEFYRTGPYGSVLAEIMTGRDERTLRHEIVFGSLLIRNLVTGENEQLMKTIAGYDQAMQVASLRRLIEVIDLLRQWET